MVTVETVEPMSSCIADISAGMPSDADPDVSDGTHCRSFCAAKRKAEEAWAPYQQRAVQAIRSRRGEEKKVRPIRLPTKWTRKSEEPICTVPRPS